MSEKSVKKLTTPLEAIRKIVVLGTGGTIAGASAEGGDNVGYVAGQVGIEDLLARMPGLAEASVSIVSEQVAQLDSKDMNWDVMREIALRCEFWAGQAEVCGIVITHGTDTLEETAWFLDCVLSLPIPVVLTCAMRPSTSAQADGPQNMSDAVALASTAGVAGVLVVCAGVVHHARFVQKVHTYRLDAFSSQDAGPVGYIEESIFRTADGAAMQPYEARVRKIALEQVATASMPKVALVTSTSSADGALIDVIVAAGFKGIVVAGTGNGTIHEALEEALLNARDKGVAIVVTTRCANAGLVLNPKKIRESNFAFIQSIGPVKARISLALDLMATN